MITPTIGRIVYFRKNQNSGIQAAIITAVWGDRCINVAVFDGNGNPEKDPPTSVTLLQEGDNKPSDGPYCEWMPYQVKKSTGSESGEKSAGLQSI